MIKNLKEVRLATGKTQKEVAAETNIGYKRYNSYETGAREPDAETLILLANYFNVTVDYLMGRSEEKNNPLTPEESERVNKFDELFSSLSEEQQKNAIDYMKFLLSNRAP